MIRTKNGKSQRQEWIKPEQHTPWAPLSYILDQVEEQETLILFRPEAGKVRARRAVEDFLRFFALNRGEVGLDANTGEVVVRCRVPPEQIDTLTDEAEDI